MTERSEIIRLYIKIGFTCVSEPVISHKQQNNYDDEEKLVSFSTRSDSEPVSFHDCMPQNCHML